MLTSHQPFSKWEGIFKDPMTTAAAMDRLVHHSIIGLREDLQFSWYENRSRRLR